MIKLKSCPRCQKGDLLLISDQYGWFYQCQQCAHIVELGKTASASHSTQSVANRELVQV